MNIAKNIERASLYFPEKAALIFEGRTYSYKELNERVNRLANALRALGVEKGDRVGVFLPNIPAFPIAYFAAQKLGAIVGRGAVGLDAQLVTAVVDRLKRRSGRHVDHRTRGEVDSLRGLAVGIRACGPTKLTGGERPE